MPSDQAQAAGDATSASSASWKIPVWAVGSLLTLLLLVLGFVYNAGITVRGQTALQDDLALVRGDLSGLRDQVNQLQFDVAGIAAAKAGETNKSNIAARRVSRRRRQNFADSSEKSLPR